jgi:hypothetical protein
MIEYEMHEISEQTWATARAVIAAQDLGLTKIIDDINPGDDLKLMRVRYPYGATIYKNGQLYLPGENGSILLTDKSVPKHIFEALNYNAVPLGCVTHHGFEVFRNVGDHIFPLAFRDGGLELGIWETFLPASPFTVVSGARTTFLLPKISDYSAHKKLKAAGVKSPVPKTLFCHWKIFTEIESGTKTDEPWYCEIYFFTKQWQERVFTDLKWVYFQNYLLKKALKHTEAYQVKITYDSVWEYFPLFLKKQNIRINNYLTDALKHLIYIAAGILPGFSVALNNTPLPLDKIQSAYLNIYGLKSYIPTIMYSNYFNAETNQPVYFPLQVITTASQLTNKQKLTTAKSTLIELIELVDLFLQQISSNSQGKKKDYIWELFSNVSFDFFHSDDCPDAGVFSTQDMPKDDHDLLFCSVDTKNNEFCGRGTATRACVRISRKN